MKKLFFFSFFIYSFSFLIISCHCKKNATSPETIATAEVKRDFEKEGYVKATVIFYEVSGCEYILKLENEKKLEPTNLSLGFKKDLLPVWIKYTAKKNAVSVCMAGEIIELIDIQAR